MRTESESSAKYVFGVVTYQPALPLSGFVVVDEPTTLPASSLIDGVFELGKPLEFLLFRHVRARKAYVVGLLSVLPPIGALARHLDDRFLQRIEQPLTRAE